MIWDSIVLIMTSLLCGGHTYVCVCVCAYVNASPLYNNSDFYLYQRIFYDRVSNQNLMIMRNIISHRDRNFDTVKRFS